MSKMTLVIASAEASPFVSTGGLGESVGTLASSLASDAVDIFLFLPRYRSINLQDFKAKKEKTALTVNPGVTSRTAALYVSNHIPGVKTIFIEHNELFDREGIYGQDGMDYSDNCARFSFFSHAVISALPILKIEPDILMCHDWHCALIPLLTKTIYTGLKQLESAKSVFTIHSMDYQGIFPATDIIWTGIGWDGYTDDNLKFKDSINLVKSAILWSDAVITLSDNYAIEICDNHENPLSTLLYDKGVTGIALGIDYDSFNPASDKLITTRFHVNDMVGKESCKSALQRNAGLPLDSDKPLMSLFGPLTFSKGMKIFADAVGPALNQLDFQCIVCGMGDLIIEQQFEYLKKIFPGKFSYIKNVDQKMFRTLIAGSDFFVIPSTNEPYQLNTLYAARYGAVPLLTQRGSLKDNMSCWDSISEDGVCISTPHIDEFSINQLIISSIKTYSTPDFVSLQQNTMKIQYSIQKSAQRFITLFTNLINK